MNQNVVVYGVPEPDFMDEIVQKAKEKKGRTVLIVPDQYKLETEQLLGRLIGGPLLHIKVMSFVGVARRILHDADVLPVTHIGRRLFLIKILNENKSRLRIFSRHLHKMSFLSDLDSILSDMSSPLSTTAFGSQELQDKIHDINLIYEAYSKISGKYLGDARLIGLSAKSAKESAFVRDSSFYVAHYDYFTDNESALYHALLRYAQGVRMTVLYDDLPEPNVYEYTGRLLAKVPSDVPVIRKSSERRSFFDRFSENVFRQDIDALREQLAASGSVGSVSVGEDGAASSSSSAGVSAEADKGESADTCGNAGADSGAGKHPHGGDAPPVAVFELSSKYAEAEMIAQSIRRLLREGVRPSEITIVLPNVEAYEGIFEQILRKMQIPFFSDRNRVFEHSPLFDFVAALLNYTESPGNEALADLLGSGVFPLREDRAMRYRIFAVENRKIPDPDGEFARVLDALKFQGLGDSFSISDFVRELHRILTRSVTYDGFTTSVMEQCERHSYSLQKISGETAAEFEYGAAIWNAFMGVLEELDELSDISGSVDYSLMRVLLDTKVTVARIPNQDEYVSITAPGRVRSVHCAYCFVPGMLRGELPATPTGTAVFTSEEEEHILHGERISAFFDYAKEAYRIHLLLTAPDRRLVFTYPSGGNRSVILTHIAEALSVSKFPLVDPADFKGERAAEGEIRAPHFAAASGGAGGFGGTKITAGRTEGFGGSGGLAGSSVAESVIEPAGNTAPHTASDAPQSEAGLGGSVASAEERVFHFSATRIQSYLDCPLRYYVTHVLRAKELKKNEISPADAGNLIHRIMEEYVSSYLRDDEAHRELKKRGVAEIARTVAQNRALYRSRVEEIERKIDDEIKTADLRKSGMYRERFLDAATLFAQIVEYQLAVGEYEVERTEGEMTLEERRSGDFEADFKDEIPELFRRAEPNDRDSNYADDSNCGDDTDCGAGVDGKSGGADDSNCSEAPTCADDSNCGAENDGDLPRRISEWMNRGNSQPLRIHLVGAFDRKDRTADSYRIIDYKTSDRYDGKISRLFDLKYIQLGIYAYLTRQEESRVCEGLHILNLVDVFSSEKWKEIREDSASDSFGFGNPSALRDPSDPGDTHSGIPSGAGGSIDSSDSAGDSGGDFEGFSATVALFRHKPMLGVYDCSERAKSKICKERDFLHTSVFKGSSASLLSSFFINGGEFTAAQRQLLAEAFFEVFREIDTSRTSLSAFLRAVGKRFYASLGKQEPKTAVEFDLLVLWSRLLIWATAKSIAAGEFTPDQSDEGYCETCPYKAMCRYERGGS